MTRPPFQFGSFLVAVCLCGALLSGCASDSGMVDPSQARARREAAARQGKPEQPATEVVRRDMKIPVMNVIGSRIRANEQKIEEWREVERKAATMSLPQDKLNRMDECRSHLQHILVEYNALQKQLQQETQVETAQLLAGDSLLALNQKDIDYLESGCGKLLAELKTLSQPVAATPPDPQIKAAYDSGDYSQVINLYAQLGQQPGQAPAVETAYQYAQALLKNHQELEARRVLGELLGRLRQQKGQSELLLQTLQSAADLSFALEYFDEARKQYEELVRLSIEKGARKDEWAGLQLAALQPGGVAPAEMKAYSTLLRNYLAYAPKRDGYNISDQADRFLAAHSGSPLSANATLIGKTSREQADAWLNQGIKRIETQAGDRRIQEPAPATGQAAGPTPPSAPATTSQVPVAPPPTVAGVEETSRLAAQDARQKAAELFVRATNSRDTEEKRKLLLGSRDLLQNILVKYPQSGLNDKIQKNLARIEAELRALDASGAPKPVTSGGAYVPPPSGTSRPPTP